MWNLQSRRLVILGLAIGAFVAPVLAAAEAAGGASSAADAVRARVEEYTRAWNTHDAGAVAAFFTEDADMVIGNGPRISGREAIQGWWAKYFSRIDEQRTGSFTVTSIRVLSPDVAVVDLDSSTGRADSEAGEMPTRLARGTWVVVQRDGEWLIAALRALPAEGEFRVTPGTDR